VSACPNCGFENTAGAKFCSECGTALEAPAARREERKVVTVVFCDLVGSTAQAERLDPEDVRAQLSAFHGRVRSELERHGGTVEKFIGDAVVAVFGAPTVHEDDAERAVRAALAVRDWALEDGDVEVRLAVNTGEALVTVDARPDAGEGMVAGDVVNTAARLQSAASVNGILVGEATYRATERTIEYREHAAVEAKGKAEPVPVWEAVAARSRFGVDVDTRPATRLVGRERELDLLVDALARVQEERAPQLVTLVGVPGMGKSRLVQELFAVVEADPELIRWRQGRSLPYGEGVSFWALGEMVKAEAGVLETDPPETAQEKLHRVVSEACEAGDAERVEAALRPLIGLADASTEGRDGREEAFAGWRRFLEGLAEQSPTVCIFEDLHWADDGLLDFVDELIDWVADVPLLVVASARPELLARRAGWGGGKPNATTLSLSPLSELETAELVHSLLERAVLPADIQAAVLARAGGNPLYAEEFARMVADRGTLEGDLPVPESLQGLIAARLDALSAAEKQLLQNAAVVGKVFWPGALAGDGHADALLRNLERKEFVRRERRSAVEAEAQYAFRHVLVRDVAYGQIPRAVRAEKHEQVAAWIEALGREADVAELLAHHYLSALEYARASGRPVEDLGSRARGALREAGHRAYGLNAFAAAKRFYEAAVELTSPSDPVWPVLVVEHARAGLYVGLENDVLLRDARDVVLAGDPERAAAAAMLLGEYAWLRGEQARAQEDFRLAEQLVADVPESDTKTNVLAYLSRFAMLADDHARSIEIGCRALALAEARGLDALRANILNNIGVSRMYLGDEGGVADLEASMAIGRTASAVEFVRAAGNLASSLTTRGRLARAEELHHEALGVARELGLVEPVEWLGVEISLDLERFGRWDESRATLDPLLALFERSTFWIEPMAHICSARIQLARGETERAAGSVERAVERARVAGAQQLLTPVLAFAARFFTETGQSARGAELAQEVFDISRDTQRTVADEEVLDLWSVLWRKKRDAELGDVPWDLHATVWGRVVESLIARDFGRAADELAAAGARRHEADVRTWAAEWLRGQGRTAEADAQARRAIAFWRSVEANAYVRRAEALLAASA
jgi:class 3 adenylate cyclase/tetratricopeptide (TPR) repeat protein